MIVNNDDALKRLDSPSNLINRLKNTSSRKDAMSLFGVNRKVSPIENFSDIEERKEPQSAVPAVAVEDFNPFAISTKIEQQAQPDPILDNILNNNEAQIKLGLAHDNAIKLLNSSINALTQKLDDVKADKLPAVISAASKTVESIRRERNEQAKTGKDREVHYHFYTPEQKKVSDYQIIEVG